MFPRRAGEEQLVAAGAGCWSSASFFILPSLCACVKPASCEQEVLQTVPFWFFFRKFLPRAEGEVMVRASWLLPAPSRGARAEAGGLVHGGAGRAPSYFPAVSSERWHGAGDPTEAAAFVARRDRDDFLRSAEDSSCTSPCMPLNLLNHQFQSPLRKQSALKHYLPVLTNKCRN